VFKTYRGVLEGSQRRMTTEYKTLVDRTAKDVALLREEHALLQRRLDQAHKAL
jgi:hypothetical protein